MKLEPIKDEVVKILKTFNYSLYDISYDRKEKTLSILIDEETLPLDKIEEISNVISEKLDTLDIEEDNYLLDVSYVGVERPIRTKEELKDALNKYIFVWTDKGYSGTLLEFDGEVLKIKYKDKNIYKTISINYADAKEIRYAIQF